MDLKSQIWGPCRKRGNVKQFFGGHSRQSLKASMGTAIPPILLCVTFPLFVKLGSSGLFFFRQSPTLMDVNGKVDSLTASCANETTVGRTDQRLVEP